jgi:hypothetical protein
MHYSNLGSASFGSSRFSGRCLFLVVTAEYYWAASVRGVLDEDDFCGSFGVYLASVVWGRWLWRWTRHRRLGRRPWLWWLRLGFRFRWAWRWAIMVVVVVVIVVMVMVVMMVMMMAMVVASVAASPEASCSPVAICWHIETQQMH